MSRYSEVKERDTVFAAADRWKHTCLIGDGSVFSDRSLWTTENVQSLHYYFTEHLDESQGKGFLEKLKGQFEDAPAESKQLLAELHWILLLPVARIISPKQKREQIETIWSWSGESMPETDLLTDEVLHGLGSGGAGYNNHRWREVEYAIDIFIGIKALPADERESLLSDGWAFAEWLEDLEGTKVRQFRHMLLHILFPDDFERIFASGDRHKVLKAFRGLNRPEIRKLRNIDRDRELLSIRRELEEQQGTEIDFYVGSLRQEWGQPVKKINESALDEYKQHFLAWFPSGQKFDTDAYYETERNYKLEIADRFSRIDQNQEDQESLCEQLTGLFTVRLDNIGGPQNLVNWRVFDFLKKFSADQKAQFTELVRELTSDVGDLYERADTFMGHLASMMQAVGENPIPSKLRGITSFYLFANDPEGQPFIKTTEIKQALKDLLREELSDEADQFEQVISFMKLLGDALKKDGWAPRDMVDLQSFVYMAQVSRDNPAESRSEDQEYGVKESHTMAYAASDDMPLNQILYGPPGTGKTFRTVDRALQILDPGFYDQNKQDRRALKARYDALKTEGRIEFVTFHQSFSYEDFVEGVRAFTDEENNQIQYVIEDGVFKNICNAAKTRVVRRNAGEIDVNDRQIWKMSLGEAHVDADEIAAECFENNYILLGWGGTLDFDGCNTLDDVRQKMEAEQYYPTDKMGHAASCLHWFKNVMENGDLVIVSDGNRKFKAIGEVTGNYEVLNDVDRDDYLQKRTVNWLQVYEPSLPHDRVMKKYFTQKPLYQLKNPSIDLNKLQDLLSGEPDVSAENNRYVLIIDEINRGNIASIFGELITLIEDSKRENNEEALRVTLPYSKQSFEVPSNLYIIGTMNTADRSLVHIDTALRRRFEFVEMMPDLTRLEGLEIENINIARMLQTLNARIELLFDREHTLGHSFFLPLWEDKSIEKLADIFRLQVLPLLEEYFFEDWTRISQILGDNSGRPREHRIFVEKFDSHTAEGLMGPDFNEELIQKALRRNDEALLNPESYLGIYETASET